MGCRRTCVERIAWESGFRSNACNECMLGITVSRSVFVDTDTASDDAVALMMAFAAPGVDLVGVGIVAGNVPLPQATQNALFIRELCHAEAPVHQGAAKPLTRPLETAQFVHGEDGMADIGLPLSGRCADPGHAALKLIDAAHVHAGTLELVTLGPLTNVALALSIAPDIAKKIKRCVIMGGASDAYGNITPVSEFNLWVDPEAARIVFASEMPKVMAGWDLSRKYAAIGDDEAAELRRIGSEKAIVAIDAQATVRKFCARTSDVVGFDFPDPLAMAIALDPAVALRSRQAAVSILVDDGPSRGMAVVDDREFSDQACTTTVVTEADRGRFLTLLRRSLR